MRTDKTQKGQAIVEFAIMLPFFMFMLIAFFYIAMLCHDYLTLTTIARDSARSAAVGVTETTIRNRYSTQTFLTSIYTWDATKSADLTITSEAEETNNAAAGNLVKVTVTARCSLENHSVMGIAFPATIQSSLTMHKEE